MPTFGSLFSGIGGIDLGLERAGWTAKWQVEIDDYRRGILGRHWPGVPRWRDVRGFLPNGGQSIGRVGRGGESPAQGRERVGDSLPASGVDLICGGFPCQDLSVAGRRAGLQGERSSLFFEFARIADALRPTRLLVENVPGLLSSNGGRDFAIVLATLAELRYGVAWRVLDSRYFGVPQRRRRVFIVGHLGVRSADPFLPFLEGGEGDPAEGGAEGKDVARALGGSSTGGSAQDGGSGQHLVAATLNSAGNDGGFRTEPGEHPVSMALSTHHRGFRQGHNSTFVTGPLGGGNDGIGRRTQDDPNLVTHSLTSEGHDASEDGTGRGTPLVGFTHSGYSNKPAWLTGDRVDSLAGGQHPSSHQGIGVMGPGAVRRLTPVECCRLQGFPDDWLGPPNEPPDSPKYAALGDAVTVNVAEWIGRRLMEAM